LTTYNIVASLPLKVQVVFPQLIYIL